MAGLANLLGKTVYLDTNIFIYAVEGYEPEAAVVREVFAALDRKAFAGVTSEFTLAELLVKPFELGREDAVSVYSDLVQHSDRITVAAVDRSILIEAARQRATLGILLPDAIHVATALASGCDVLITNDRRLKLPLGNRVGVALRNRLTGRGSSWRRAWYPSVPLTGPRFPGPPRRAPCGPRAR